LSPRAACRLETLGFEAVYDYVPGKVDWLARGLPTEGDEAPPPRVGKLARHDVATCGLKDRVEEIQTSPYGFCLVLAEDGTVLGRVRRSDMNGHTAEDAMSPGPSTVRYDLPVGELRERLDKKGLKTAIVTTPEGKLIGVVRRKDLES
jgi:CBS-domain-containing membrane protein